MTDTTTPVPLAIPTKARTAAAAAYSEVRTYPPAAAAAAICAASPIIVAAELRRLAAWLWDDTPYGRQVHDTLADRADELDPDGAR